VAECSERERLSVEVQQTLIDIIVFAERLRDAVVNSLEGPSVIKLDKDLENALGAKERAFGALAQHRKDHGC
jgi:hypothetical protein